MRGLLKEYKVTTEQVTNYCEGKQMRGSVVKRIEKYIKELTGKEVKK